MAGLAAARALAESGRSVVVLEASSRIGGRILTVREADEVMELGAEFIHGHPPELWSLIQEAGLETYELDGPRLRFENGQFGPAPQAAAPENETVPALQRPQGYTRPDITFAQVLGQK